MQCGVFDAHISVHIAQYTEVQRLCKKHRRCKVHIKLLLLKCGLLTLFNLSVDFVVVRCGAVHCVIAFYTALHILVKKLL
jgi:hypothetical protein